MASADHDTRTGPAISVTMEGDRVVIRPSGHLDVDGIEAVRALLAGAAAAGVTAAVDLRRIARRDRPAVEAALGLPGAPVLVA
ncbi:MAG: hypothetical protein ABW219_17465 [Ilumatobacteraceae bacterium]